MLEERQQQQQEQHNGKPPQPQDDLLWKIKILVTIDFLAVAILVPLLSSYFRELNISTEKYGLMSSAYSLSQLVGGLLLGALSDHVVSRRTILLVSFLGSAVSYWLVGVSHSFALLLLSRVVVGLVKQTMTVCTAMLAEHMHGSEEKGGNRAQQMGRLSACATGAFVVGPIVGSFLYRRHKLLPPLASAALFLLNCALVLALLPPPRRHGAKAPPPPVKENGGGGGKRVTLRQRAFALARDLRSSCSLRPCFTVVAAKLANSFLAFAMDRSLVVGYYEERWKVESYALGYLRSYSTLVMLGAQVYLVGRLARSTSESTLAACAMAAIAAAAALEAAPIGLHAYLALALPLRLAAQGLLSTCLQTLFTRRMPRADLGAALGAMGVLQSASGVLAPLYGGALLRGAGARGRAAAAGAHYLAFAALWVAAEAWAGCSDGSGDGGGGDAPEQGGGNGGARSAATAASVDGVVVAVNGGGVGRGGAGDRVKVE